MQQKTNRVSKNIGTKRGSDRSTCRTHIRIYAYTLVRPCYVVSLQWICCCASGASRTTSDKEHALEDIWGSSWTAACCVQSGPVVGHDNCAEKPSAFPKDTMLWILSKFRFSIECMLASVWHVRSIGRRIREWKQGRATGAMHLIGRVNATCGKIRLP